MIRDTVQDHLDHGTSKELINHNMDSLAPLMYHELSDPVPDHPKGMHPMLEWNFINSPYDWLCGTVPFQNNN